ncbi:coenzyme F390 synthetase [Geoanaerobacter pelophilus]|uniref:Coenzyme F390 synthetase n=1 Tax=Geoanaerobacter pelophilus TaxID=60036 RepID=A0ABQ0MHW9_9BACT|nr:AMP-binding protein [Geoanaerobacter pelophilus]GAW66690.1 coenzyme F390 synthetase [Geoanaerobacter pelophilus]
MKKTPLEEWLRGKVAGNHDGTLAEQIDRYQLIKLRETVAYVREKSPFYRDLFCGTGAGSTMDIEDFSRLPFTTADDLREQGGRMLCTSQDEIERVVTLQSSGTTGQPKRIFYTAEDLEATVDFFAHGMATLVDPGATVIVFLPGELRDSVGDLLARALVRTKVNPVVWGPVRDPAAARAEIMKHPHPCLVGIPTQMLALARGDLEGAIPRGWVESVLLSTDYVPEAIERELEQRWGCRVLTHYGMTETGLGGGVECQAAEGYHLREADLYTEIIDPGTGLAVADGEEGEVVFTTLSRRGMPLVRYRTGDLARLIKDPCPCGTVLKRLGRVQGRIAAEVSLKDGRRLRMSELDETLFAIPGVLDYTAELEVRVGRDQLRLCFQTVEGEEAQVARKARSALLSHDATSALWRDKVLALGSIGFSPAGWPGTGVAKRQILDRRGDSFTLTASRHIHASRLNEGKRINR